MSTQRLNQTGFNSLVQYQRILDDLRDDQVPGGGTPAAESNFAPIRLPDPDPTRPTTRNGMFVAKDLAKATRNGVFSNGEVEVLKGRIGNINNADELGDVLNQISIHLSRALIRLEDRAELGNAIMAKAQQVEGGNAHVGDAFTEAVGEDVFGMGALPLNAVGQAVYNASLNETITDYEVGKIIGAMDQIENRWEVFSALTALSFAVNGNVIDNENRGKLAGAFHAMANRVGEGFAVTEAHPEDVFGMGDAGAMDIITKSVRDGAFQSYEVSQLEDEIQKIDSKQSLANVYLALDRSIGDPKRDPNAKLIRQKDRGKLEKALIKKDRELNADVIPGAVIALVGQDIFGAGDLVRTESQKSAMIAQQTSVTSQRNVDKFAETLQGIDNTEDLFAAHAVAQQMVQVNIISRDNRRKLADAFHTKARELDTGFAATRALNEDIFGGGAAYI